MVRILFDHTVLASCKEPIVLEGNYYFPPKTVSTQYFKPSKTSTECPTKGTASYYSADVYGKFVKDIAWYYPEPKEEATDIRGYIAFYTDKVTVQDYC